jgi:diguanylate cyclase
MRSIEKPASRRKSARKKGNNSPSPFQKLNLTAAVRILQQAGRPDPTRLSDDFDIRLQTIIDALCDLSVHDGLTGLVNATFFHAVMSREIDRSCRTGRTCGLVVIDIDHFKKINDTYGHYAGDAALQSLAQNLKKYLRNMDTAARIGGEEFAVILPECTPEDAIHAAARLHATLNPLTVNIGNQVLTITTSIGLVWTDGRTTLNSKTFLSKADQEMYRAKREGRGRLCHPQISTTQISLEERAALTFGKYKEENNVQ